MAEQLDPALLAAIQEAVAAGMAAQPLAAAAEVSPLAAPPTPKLGLAKPAYDDPADIMVINGNMDILDNSITADQIVTLTNKTLTAPIINNPTITGWTNAQHTHIGAAGGGSLDGAAITSGTLGTGFLLRETGASFTDPLIRDILWFGAKPSGAGDTSLRRTAAGALRVDTTLGVGVTPAAWDTARPAIQVGGPGAVWADTSVGGAVRLSGNTYYDAVGFKALAATAAAKVELYQGTVKVDTAPSVAAGAAQTFTTRLTIDNAGNLGVGRPPSPWGAVRLGFDLGQQGFLQASTNAPVFFGGVNTYWDASGDHALVTGASTRFFTTAAEGFGVAFAPSVAAGALQTYTNKLVVSPTGTLALTPDAGQDAIAFGVPDPVIRSTNSIILHGAAMAALRTNTQQVALYPPGGGMYPGTNGQISLGINGQAFTTVWATTGAFNGSHVSQKEHIAPLDPAACAQAVLDTEWWEFDYKPPAEPDGLPDAQRTEWAASVARDADSRHARGYVLGSPDHKVSDLFGLRDRRNQGVTSDLAVVAAALQHALKGLADARARIASLEDEVARLAPAA